MLQTEIDLNMLVTPLGSAFDTGRSGRIKFGDKREETCLRKFHLFHSFFFLCLYGVGKLIRIESNFWTIISLGLIIVQPVRRGDPYVNDVVRFTSQYLRSSIVPLCLISTQILVHTQSLDTSREKYYVTVRFMITFYEQFHYLSSLLYSPTPKNYKNLIEFSVLIQKFQHKVSHRKAKHEICKIPSRCLRLEDAQGIHARQKLRIVFRLGKIRSIDFCIRRGCIRAYFIHWNVHLSAAAVLQWRFR